MTPALQLLSLLIIILSISPTTQSHHQPLSLGVCYYPEQHSLCDPHRLNQTLSSHIQTIQQLNISHVRLFEFAWGLLNLDESSSKNFQCLDKIVTALHSLPTDIIMGTPSATPPRFIVNDLYEKLLPVSQHNHVRKFGSRRHYSFASEEYKEEYVRGIVKELVTRYHEDVSLWQIDNELGDHDTLRTYDAQSCNQFQQWLRAKYDSNITKMNDLWGNVFWSMQYERFEDVELPNLVVAQANPIHWLEFYRFSSDQAVKFHEYQTNILREHDPKARVTSNYLGWDEKLNHYTLGIHQDVFSWDSYPLGILDVSDVIFSAEEKRRFYNTGHPDFAAWNHDHVACSDPNRPRQPFIVMEQQPGPVNWAKNNPSPAPGMLYLWALEAFAHSANVVSFFRLQQFPSAQEQFHSAILLSNGEPDEAYFEIRDKILPALRTLNVYELPVEQGDVALIFDYDSAYSISILPQGENFRYMHLVFIFYKALRSLGFNIDIVDAKADYTGYKMLVFPTLIMPTQEVVTKLASFKGHVLFGPRSGSKTEFFSIPPNLAPGYLHQLMDFTVTRVSSLPEGIDFKVQSELGGSSTVTMGKYWRETIRVKPDSKGIKVVGVYEDTKSPAIVKQRNFMYIAFWPEEGFIRGIVQDTIGETSLADNASNGLRIRKRGDLYFAMNYEASAVELQPIKGCTMEFVLGKQQVDAHSVSVFRLLNCLRG
eukprot:CAMPEP_0117450162 /NCGR_PEP_ID=MMETSP0759-20121206/8322_1 /TAXON_ID=63605 /ORGANISM="Percolomonas cosmopolitus, Strain WS" /LENGTH=707 /DNA_ID=CAMNT_0005242667 /DNA_START=10 /DNA_END=2133 /DNA_ORIENTATION=-